jgi:nitrogen regulatory protein P-II 2
VRYATVYVKPFRLDDVVETLARFPVEEVAIEEVRGYGRQKGHLELYSGSEYSITFLPKVKVEFAAPDGSMDEIVRAVCEAARTGRIGDGKIFVRDIRREEEL